MTFISFAGFALLIFAWMAQFCYLRASDLDLYKNLKAKQETTSSSRNLYSTTNQTRQGVSKDIWFTQEDKTRLHYRIESRSSLLTLVPKEADNFEVIENLQGIKCWMQDKLYFSDDHHTAMQQMRFFEADEGTYTYTSQQFIAQTVTLSLFRLPGHSLVIDCNPKKAFLKGIAKDVSFSVSGNTPQFQAQHFKASFKNNGDS